MLPLQTSNCVITFTLYRAPHQHFLDREYCIARYFSRLQLWCQPKFIYKLNSDGNSNALYRHQPHSESIAAAVDLGVCLVCADLIPVR